MIYILLWLPEFLFAHQSWMRTRVLIQSLLTHSRCGALQNSAYSVDHSGRCQQSASSLPRAGKSHFHSPNNNLTGLPIQEPPPDLTYADLSPWTHCCWMQISKQHTPGAVGSPHAPPLLINKLLFEHSHPHSGTKHHVASESTTFPLRLFEAGSPGSLLKAFTQPEKHSRHIWCLLLWLHCMLVRFIYITVAHRSGW